MTNAPRTAEAPLPSDANARADVRIHLVELGGTGGVYQHTVALAEALANEGWSVTLHTANVREVEPRGIVIYDACDWRKGLSSQVIRRILFFFDVAFRSWPHLLRDLTSGDVVHVQGAFLLPLATVYGRLARRRGAKFVISPHNTFARRGFRLIGNASIRWGCKLADSVIVYSKEDRRRVEAWGISNVTVSPLLMYVPIIDKDTVRNWRTHWLGEQVGRVILAPGYIRPDKGIELVIEAAAVAERAGARDLRLAVVGQDAGGVTLGRATAHREGIAISWTLDYLPLTSFAAAIASADAVVLAHKIASQSAVIRIARQLGVPTIAPDTGGLREECNISYPPGDIASLAHAMSNVRRRLPGSDAVNLADREECLRAHRRAYRL